MWNNFSINFKHRFYKLINFTYILSKTYLSSFSTLSQWTYKQFGTSIRQFWMDISQTDSKPISSKMAKSQKYSGSKLPNSKNKGEYWLNATLMPPIEDIQSSKIKNLRPKNHSNYPLKRRSLHWNKNWLSLFSTVQEKMHSSLNLKVYWLKKIKKSSKNLNCTTNSKILFQIGITWFSTRKNTMKVCKMS